MQTRKTLRCIGDNPVLLYLRIAIPAATRSHTLPLLLFASLFLLPVAFTFGQDINSPNPPKRSDSLRHKGEEILQQKAKKLLGQATATGNMLDMKQYSGEFNQLVRDAKSLGQPVLSKLKIFDKEKSLRIGQTNFDFNYTYLRDTSAVALGGLNSMNGIMTYSAGTNITVISLPFQFSFRGANGLYDLNAPSFDQLTKFNFDHGKYVESIKNKVLKNLEPGKVLSTALSRINQLRENYEKMLLNEISSLKNNLAQEYGSVIDLPNGITDLTQNDLSSLKNKLLNEAELAKYRQNAERVQELLKSKNVDAIMQDSLSKSYMAGIKRFETLEKIYRKISEFKGKFENNGLVKNLRNNLPFTKDKYASFLSKPANLEKVIDEHIDLNMLQRLFFNITKLDLGQNPVNAGEYSLQNLINTGMNMEFRNKKATVGLLYGKNNNVNSWLQSGLTSPLTNEYSRVAGIKLGSGSASALDQSISVNFFEFSNFLPRDNRDIALQTGMLGMPQRRDATISFHSGYSFSGKHRLTLDVSKSIGSYVNNLAGDSVGYKSNAYSELFNQSGRSNFAAMLDYTGEIAKTDVQVFIKKTGMGFNNPGNTLSRAGETQLNLGIARRLLEQKLNVRYTVNYRKQNFDPLKRYAHIAISNKLQASYRINRNNRVGISYYRNDFDSKLFAGTTTGGSTTRLQAEGAYSLRVAGKKIINNVTLSHQQMQVPILADQDYKNNSVMLMHSSVVVLNKNPMTLMVLLNRSDNKDYLFNTSMFSTELSYSYVITSSIRLGNSLGYYDNSGWNRQLGAKQQFTAVLMDRLNVDIDFMYKKAVQVIRPELANQIYVSSGVRYNF